MVSCQFSGALTFEIFFVFPAVATTTQTRTHTHTHRHTNTHSLSHTRTHTHTHKYTHTPTHTLSHTNALTPPPPAHTHTARISAAAVEVGVVNMQAVDIQFSADNTENVAAGASNPADVSMGGEKDSPPCRSGEAGGGGVAASGSRVVDTETPPETVDTTGGEKGGVAVSLEGGTDAVVAASGGNDAVVTATITAADLSTGQDVDELSAPAAEAPSQPSAAGVADGGAGSWKAKKGKNKKKQ